MAKGKYKLLHNEAYVDYEGDEIVEIGKMVDTETSTDAMFIYYDKNLYKNAGYHMTCYVHEDEEGELPVCMVSDMHRECFFAQRNVFLAMVLHEYGHYLHGDLKMEGVTNKQIQEERVNCIRENRVMEIELAADEFAVSHVGKNVFLRSLDYLIQTRRARNDTGMFMAIKEFELRKKAVQKMK